MAKVGYNYLVECEVCGRLFETNDARRIKCEKCSAKKKLNKIKDKGEYFCTKCKKTHRIKSRIGREHLEKLKSKTE